MRVRSVIALGIALAGSEQEADSLSDLSVQHFPARIVNRADTFREQEAVRYCA